MQNMMANFLHHLAIISLPLGHILSHEPGHSNKPISQYYFPFLPNLKLCQIEVLMALGMIF